MADDLANSYSGIVEKERHETTIRILPVIISMSIFSVVGIIGNILTIAFYMKSKRSSTVILIVFLAVSDLLVSVLLILNVVEMIINVTFTNAVICKFSHAFGGWFIIASCLILGVIAIDRHRKICRPFGWQITITIAKRIFGGIIILTFFLSTFCYVSFDIVKITLTDVIITNSDGTINNMTVAGSICTTRKDFPYNVIAFAFYAVDFALVIIVWITMIATYSQMIYTLVKMQKIHQRKSHRASSQHKKVSGTKSTDESTLSVPAITINTVEALPASSFKIKPIFKTMDMTHSPYTSDTNTTDNCPSDSDYTHSSTNQPDAPEPERPKKKTSVKRKRKVRRISSKQRRLTFMMLTVSILFIVCVAPYFIVKLIMRIAMDRSYEHEIDVPTQFAIRLIYVNSMVNPVVYLVFNPEMRTYLKTIFLRMLPSDDKRDNEQDEGQK